MTTDVSTVPTGTAPGGDRDGGPGGAQPPEPARWTVVPDRLQLRLPAGTTVLVFSDLHLTTTADARTRRTGEVISRRLAECTGPACLVLNGDVLDLWADPAATAGAVLDAHPELTAGIAGFLAAPDRSVVLVVGNHDGRLGWDEEAAASVAARWSCRCTLALDLVLPTPAGERTVHLEHGHQLDPMNAVHDPRNPLDTSPGRHAVQYVLRADSPSDLVQDVRALADRSAVLRLTRSRLVYRQVIRHAWWPAVPLGLSLLLRVPLVVHHLSGDDELSRLPALLPLALLAVGVDVIGVVVALTLVLRSVTAALALPVPADPDPNRLAREATVTRTGGAGAPAVTVTSHTHEPELTPLGTGVYANTGCCERVLVEEPARFRLPPVFRAVHRVSWLELAAGHDLRAELRASELDLGELTLVERLVARPARPARGDVVTLASVPGSAGFPIRSTGLAERRRHERIRGTAAMVVSAAAVLTLVSALTAPYRGRLEALLHLVPVQVPQTAASSAAFLSVGLLLLGRGLRRGQRWSWAAAVALLAASAALNLVKGIDVEEALVAAGVAVWLARHRAAFPVLSPARHLRPATAAVLAVGATTATSVVAVLVAGAHRMVGTGDTALAERLVGDTSRPLTDPGAFVTPVLLSAGFAVLLACGLVLTRLRRTRPLGPDEHRAARERARAIVMAHGGDSLAYFALRDDKDWFFSGDCVVAYSVRDGVCLVSPDPVGPPAQWVDAWNDFIAFADRHGWPVAVVGASAGWLAVYAATGMGSMYIGDEAVVDCPAFSLEGRPMKQLRSACRRVERAGYAVTFHDPAELDPATVAELQDILTQSRRGQVERGFSMTLSRAFDPHDTGLLLAVARDAGGRAAAFCQFVPAPGIAGWSLDLMRRRDDPDLPNGLTDLIIIRTIEHLQAAGSHGLSLNFAVMRGVLAGEQGSGPVAEVQRRVLTRFSSTMQIASLWHYNEKFGPAWLPRYVAVGRLTAAATQTLAIADAEGVTELPVVGRFMGRRNRVVEDARC